MSPEFLVWGILPEFWGHVTAPKRRYVHVPRILGLGYFAGILGTRNRAEAALVHVPRIPFVQTRYPFLIYIPQAFGIALGQACGLQALALLYAGRIVNLFCWLAVMFVALRTLPPPKGSFCSWRSRLPEGGKARRSVPMTIQAEEDPEHGLGVRQTWQKPDRDLAPDRRFGITLTNLKPYSHYRFFCRARCPNRNRFYIEAWSPVYGPPIEAHWRCLEHYVAKIPAASPHAHFRSFSGDFFTGRSGTVRLVTMASDPQGEYPASVTWDDWTLTKIPLGMPWRRLFLWRAS